MKCRVCSNNKNNRIISVKEMMIGTRELFDYLICNKCDCIQILNYPQNLNFFYSSNYYSLKTIKHSKENFLKKSLKKLRNNYTIFNKSFTGQLIYYFFPNKQFRFLSNINLNYNSSILDVGCGNGEFLLELNKMGFNNLLGIDTYLDQDIDYSDNLKIIKKNLKDINSTWDVVIFNHSFEHFFDPKSVFKQVNRILNVNGVCIIRMPIVPCYAFEKYQENWVQIDAPRHMIIHSIKSINFLIKEYKLKLLDIKYDSDEFRFWGSIQYKNNIPLTSSNSYFNEKRKSIFSSSQIKVFKKKAKDLNIKEIGDQCIFYLKRIK